MPEETSPTYIEDDDDELTNFLVSGELQNRTPIHTIETRPTFVPIRTRNWYTTTSSSTTNKPMNGETNQTMENYEIEQIKYKILHGEIKIDLNRLAWSDYTEDRELRSLLHGYDVTLIYSHLTTQYESLLLSNNEHDRIALFSQRIETMDAMIHDYIVKFISVKDTGVKYPDVSSDKVEELVATVKVGASYGFSFGTFKAIYPNIELIKKPEDVANYDLIIVPGGEDINPTYYNQNSKYSDYNKFRDEVEVPIVTQALMRKKKVFGTCRGHQLVNVLLSSPVSYSQDLFNDGYSSHESRHVLDTVLPYSIANKFFNKPVVSLHHQGVIRVNNGVRATSKYKGVIESCENNANTIITTQFHPEFQEGNENFWHYLKYWARNLERYYKPIVEE